MVLRKLDEHRFGSCAGAARPLVLPLRDGASGGGVINAHLLWDAIPLAADGSQMNCVLPDMAVVPCTRRLFDLATLLAPPVDDSAAPALLAANRQSIKQRNECAPAPHCILPASLQCTRASSLPPPLACRAIASVAQQRQILADLLCDAAPLAEGGSQRLHLHTELVPVSASGTPALNVTIWAPQGDLVTPWTTLCQPWQSEQGGCAVHPLRSVLACTLQDRPQVARTERELHATPPWQELASLLAGSEAPPDLLEAPQPQGLATGVTLYKYQRCAASCAHHSRV